MPAEHRTVYTQFTKSELLKIANTELGMTVPVQNSTKAIVQAIYDNIETEGLPDPYSCNDLVFEFLVVAEYIDESGNVLEEGVEEDSISEEDYPKCFSLADLERRDPSCEACKIFDKCSKKRIASRPNCFGKLYDSRDEQCKVCIEALYCSQISNTEA